MSSSTQPSPPPFATLGVVSKDIGVVGLVLDAKKEVYGWFWTPGMELGVISRRRCWNLVVGLVLDAKTKVYGWCSTPEIELGVGSRRRR
ncbi:hypothetical protein L6452_02265 [Arctium lappa]|uniref:Uncharacterized protein n=1 Tax=Arctium lappa TaxID=4217 RepID=A0ACB9FJ28_ARCLA|nr:hypothetical protein L6452_02265 [Arctium lappa]